MIEKTKRGIPKAQEVMPIKNPKDIQKIKQFLKGKDNKRDYLIFNLGFNVGLRAGDLVRLKICDVMDEHYHIVDEVVITEEKTDKTRGFTINGTAKEAINLYIKSLKKFNLDDYLFKSRKGINQHLTVDALHKIIKTVCREQGIKGNYGSHSLRKTFAYNVYIQNIKDNPGILTYLQKMLNHSSSAVTLRYIGIEKEDIKNIYLKLVV